MRKTTPDNSPQAFSMRNGISSRLLLLVLVFMLVIELVYFVPSLAYFREGFLTQRVTDGEMAALTLEEMPGNTVSDSLEAELLQTAGVNGVIITRDGTRQLILRQQMPRMLAGRYDMREAALGTLIMDALETVLRGGEGFIQVRGEPRTGRYQAIMVVMDERALFTAMKDFTVNNLGFSLLLTGLTGGLIFMVLSWLFVRPLCRIADNIQAFREAPEDSTRVLRPGARKDEIGLVESELARLQAALGQSLQEKTRLANLGLAISKINHDLRNILSSAQMSSDRLAHVEDPAVRKSLPRIVRAIDRAVTLCQSTLRYGKAQEAPPRKQSIALAAILDEVATALEISDKRSLRFYAGIEPDYRVSADPDHLFRILTNLLKNAITAMDGTGRLEITARVKDGYHRIMISDTGPGIPDNLRKTLFQPFMARSQSGAGLGLAIARELAEAHGGDLQLQETGAEGTVFVILLPLEDGDSDTDSAEKGRHEKHAATGGRGENQPGPGKRRRAD